MFFSVQRGGINREEYLRRPRRAGRVRGGRPRCHLSLCRTLVRSPDMAEGAYDIHWLEQFLSNTRV